MQTFNEIETTSLIGRILVASVVNNVDPLDKDRVQIRVEGLHTDTRDPDLPWALPITKDRVQGSSINTNYTNIPGIGSDVYVIFDGGNKYSPLMLGVVRNPLTSAWPPSQYGFVDLAGNTFKIDTAANTVEFKHASGTTLTIDAVGDVTVDSVSKVSLTASGDVDIDSTGSNVNITSTGNTSVTCADVNMTVTNTATVEAASIVLNSTGPTTITGNPVAIL